MKPGTEYFRYIMKSGEIWKQQIMLGWHAQVVPYYNTRTVFFVELELGILATTVQTG